MIASAGSLRRHLFRVVAAAALAVALLVSLRPSAEAASYRNHVARIPATPTSAETVSYTHLDVYKRQALDGDLRGDGRQAVVALVVDVGRGEGERAAGQVDGVGPGCAGHAIAAGTRGDGLVSAACLLYTSRCV